MRSLQMAIVSVLLLTATLAGCASPTTGDDGSSIDPSVDVQPTETTGIIKGVVVDAAVKPLAKATVSVKVGDKTLTNLTNGNGGFGFQGLPPGTYFVSAALAGYKTSQQSVDVVANDPDVKTLRIGLEADASFAKPYVQPYIMKGYIECSVSAFAIGGDICGIVNIINPGTFDDTFSAQYPLDPVIPTWTQSELIWKSTQNLGAELTLDWSRDCGNDNQGFLCDYGVSGTSPLLLTADTSHLRNITIQRTSGEHTLYIRVFNSGLAETTAGGTFGLGVTYEQSFEVYTHMFYGYKPTTGWRFSSGQPVPQPK